MSSFTATVDLTLKKLCLSAQLKLEYLVLTVENFIIGYVSARFDSNPQVDVTYADLSKAFDRVDKSYI